MAPNDPTFDRQPPAAGKRAGPSPRPARRKQAKTTVNKSRRMSSRTRNLASVWALIAGVALAGAVSSSLSPSGRERLSGMFSGDAEPVSELAQTDFGQDEWQGDEAPEDAPVMITGSIENRDVPQPESVFPEQQPVAFNDIADLSAEVARLRTENRRLRIERDALRGRLAQSNQPPRSTATATSPGLVTAPARPTPAQPTPDITVRAMPLEQRSLSDIVLPSDGATEEAIRASLQRVVAVEAAREENLQPVSATRFAIDIGSGNTLGEVRGRWQSFARTYPEIANALIPAVSVIEGGDGTTRLHLLAGPLPNAADAVDLCARLRDAGVLCSTTVFDGQRLASQ